MIDFFDIPNISNTQVFYAQVSGNTSPWQTWQKPKNCRIVNFFVLGGGGGGGAGRSSNSNTACGGGGGGSSSSTSALFPANLLPDTLFILVGSGGAGGLSSAASNGGTGATGSISYVSTNFGFGFLGTGYTSNNNVLLTSGDVPATGGNGGRLSDNTGAAGVAGTVFSTTNGLFSYLGILNTKAGQNGTAGSFNANASNITSVEITSGGAGGGGSSSSFSSFRGGWVNNTNISIIPSISGGSAGLGSNSTNGGSGFISLNPSSLVSNKYPFVTTGGAGGGGSTNNGVGSFNSGNGGVGGYGSGGGGGGGAYNGVGGDGGRGGDGIVIITCW
jgi:hypothetical protein